MPGKLDPILAASWNCIRSTEVSVMGTKYTNRNWTETNYIFHWIGWEENKVNEPIHIISL